MKLRELIFLLVLIITPCKQVVAQNATFKKISIAPSDDYNWVVVHVDFDISGCLNTEGWVYVFFYDENHNNLISPDNQFSLLTDDGKNVVSCCQKFTPAWASTTYTDFTVSIPPRELHLGDWGANKPLYYTVGIWINNKWLSMKDNNRCKITYYNMLLLGMCIPDGNNSFIQYMKNHTNGKTEVKRYDYALPWGNNSNPNQGGYSGGSGYSGGGSFGGTGSSSKSKMVTCSWCGGSGKQADQIRFSPNYTGKDNSVYCSQCGTTKPAHTHYRQNCGKCGGSGKVQIH